MVTEPVRLRIINACLSLMGQAGLASEAEFHPMLGDAQRVLETELRAALIPGYWFNVHDPVTLTPMTDSRIVVPMDSLSTIPSAAYPGQPRFSQVGRLLYTSTGSDTWDRPLYVRVVRAIGLEDCPPSFQDYVGCRTELAFGAAFDADNGKLQLINARLQAAQRELQREDIRQQGWNSNDTNPVIWARTAGRYGTGVRRAR